MNHEPPNVERRDLDVAQAKEIEFALILSRMISSVKEEPSQLRALVYEFARARLQTDTSWAGESERQQISSALEAAIEGVEQFSRRYGEGESLLSQPSSPGNELAPPTLTPQTTSIATVRHFAPEADDLILVPGRPNLRYQVQPPIEVRARSIWTNVGLPFLVGVSLCGAVAGGILLSRDTDVRSALAERLGYSLPKSPFPQETSHVSVPAPQPQAPVSSVPDFPLPADYGVYALNDRTLSELYALRERVPDKRIAMSTPVMSASKTTIPDGKTRFVVFRRDLVGNAPDRVDIRVVARVSRALTFDPKGKPAFMPISDAWNIRNVSYEFRVRPIPGNVEMLLVQAENPDFVLPPGRYLLALGEKGYDFTVAGMVTDSAQCLERTDASNGTFYSECPKQK
jgi:hypothetical protein